VAACLTLGAASCPRMIHLARLNQVKSPTLSNVCFGSKADLRLDFTDSPLLAHAGAHSWSTCWEMGCSKREESGGALLAFDGQASPHSSPQVSRASAPQGSALRRNTGGLRARSPRCPLTDVVRSWTRPAAQVCLVPEADIGCQAQHCSRHDRHGVQSLALRRPAG
jgi:hypothetical protein